MPVRNEAAFMDRNLEIVLAQDYPADRFEVLVCDGMSDDGTRDVVARWCAKDSRCRLIDNPGRIVSTGLNAGIQAARGEIILRIDGHVYVAADFMRQSILLLQEHPEAWCAGGPIQHSGGTRPFSHAVAAAQSHPLGVGNARHRYHDYEGYAEGAVFPAIHRWVFDKVGGFDEQLVRNQDDEFNFRVTQAGGKIFISPRVKSQYFVRDRLRTLFLQYFQYSFWRVPMLKKHRRPTHLRQLIPPLFYVAVFVLAILGAVLGDWWLGATLPAIYATALLAAGVASIPRLGFRVGLLLPCALMTMHAGYAWGYLYGLFCAIFRPQAWDPQGRMGRLSR